MRPARPLPANAEVVLLRAAQEALVNVRKHAHASDVRVIAVVHQRGDGEDASAGAFGKLGVSDRTAAVTTAIELGDIPPPGR